MTIIVMAIFAFFLKIVFGFMFYSTARLRGMACWHISKPCTHAKPYTWTHLAYSPEVPYVYAHAQGQPRVHAHVHGQVRACEKGRQKFKESHLVQTYGSLNFKIIIFLKQIDLD